MKLSSFKVTWLLTLIFFNKPVIFKNLIIIVKT